MWYRTHWTVVSAFILATFLVAAGTVSAQEPGADALVVAFGFNEGFGTGTADASPNGLDAQISSATWSTAGRYGQAISFDGANDLVTVPGSPLLNLTTGMTIQAWVYPTTLAGWHTAIFKERSNGLSYALYAHDGATGPAAYLRLGGNDRFVDGAGQLAASTWTHLAASYDGTTLRLYVNGGLTESLAVGGSIATTSDPLRIGGNTVWGEYFNGLIDEVRVHDRALSATEIQALMALPIGEDPGFEFILYDSAISMGRSDAGLFNLGIAPNGNFTSWVFPTISGLPADTTAAFEPVDGPPHPGPFAMSVTTGPAAPGGTYSLTLTGTNGTISATTNISLTIATDPDFRVAVEPNALTLVQGQSGVATYEVTAQNGYAEDVTLETTGLPAGALSAFQPDTLVPSGVGSLHFTLGPSTAPGVYPVQIVATDGVLTNDVAFELTVQENVEGGAWRQVSLGDSGAKYYGVIVGDVGNTGTNRVYGSAGDGRMFEYGFDGSAWSFSEMPIGEFNDGEMHNMAIGPARGDGTNRLYIAAVSGARAYELSWINGAWETNIAAVLSGCTDMVIGDGRNDGVTRMYVTWMAGTTELTWNGADWTQVTMSSGESGWVHGVELGDGRNDGTNRVYTSNQGNGDVHEFTWNGSAWLQQLVGDTADARNVEVGDGRHQPGLRRGRGG